MDNVQNCDSYILVPSSQTYKSQLYLGHGKYAAYTAVHNLVTFTLLITKITSLGQVYKI
jgi:hypothetical protein